MGGKKENWSVRLVVGRNAGIVPEGGVDGGTVLPVRPQSSYFAHTGSSTVIKYTLRWNSVISKIRQFFGQFTLLYEGKGSSSWVQQILISLKWSYMISCLILMSDPLTLITGPSSFEIIICFLLIFSQSLILILMGEILQANDCTLQRSVEHGGWLDRLGHQNIISSPFKPDNTVPSMKTDNLYKVCLN